MKILFLTLLDFKSLNEKNIYTDLLREFVKYEHSVCAISPVEKRSGGKTELLSEHGVKILKLRIGNIQKTNLVEKGISTVTLETTFIGGIKKFFSNVKFDLVLYSTPPITFCRAVEFVKKRDNAKTYLLLKDIFPQNAIDIGMLSKTGFRGILYNYFRKKEKQLYAISDYIGCMSQANVEYILKHNLELKPDVVEVCPNSVEVVDMRIDVITRKKMREKYGIPFDKKVFVYGGNLGKPQGIPFLIECLKTQVKNPDVYFLIIGDGTEFRKLEKFFDEQKPSNMQLMQRLPKEDYDQMVAACDIGMIFLDYRFTIPNFPSRLLSYMQAGIPVLAVTDSNTDVGEIIVNGGFGWWCSSDNDVIKFKKIVNFIIRQNLRKMGNKGFNYLQSHYSARNGVDIILKHFK